MAHSNNLIHETSPYLLQHAHNPVNWYPWGEEALQLAKKNDKPILVSIGYSACHWCHVMERESFEDEGTAAIMNENFINIKIDREERPDLDHIYMDAVQAISGSGGWPLNVFLTPDTKPFYGGTYFPPVRAFNRSSWKEVLESITQVYKNKREEVEQKAEELTQFLKNSGMQNVAPLINSEENLFSKEDVSAIFDNVIKQTDKVWGGFGNAPKFPQTFTINFLLRYFHYSQNETALKYALLSLDKMIDGGIYDQIGGGFARYSTDAEWLAPHFEKMLYDNALLIISLSEAFQITKNKKYQLVIEQTIQFIKRELMHQDGGFYAALDADSEGIEGKYYVWSYAEIHDILNENAAIFCAYYDVSISGNWEHQNILRVLKSKETFIKEQSIDEAEFEKIISRSSEKLLAQRNKRIHPATDDKIILGWNCLMIIALCKAAASLQKKEYMQLAEDTFAFVIEKFSVNENGSEFFHTYKSGVAKYPAFLDDYAYLISAAIHLQEITSDEKYLTKAKLFTEYVINNFSDEQNLFFYYTSTDQRDIIARKKEIYDGAVPSGNSVMAANLLYLSIVFDKLNWKDRSLKCITTLHELIIKYPTSFGNWNCIFIEFVQGIKEIALIGEGHADHRDALLNHYIPGKAIQCNAFPQTGFPLLNRPVHTNEIIFFLCKNYTCELPIYNFNTFVKALLTT